jgi:predicted nuclease of predicted toxin-antitoxin system
VKILLDECVPIVFRHVLPGHEVHSVQWAGLKEKKNGELLRLAELAGYEVLLTVDQSIRYQQSLAGRKLAIVVMCGQTNQIDDLTPMAGRVMSAFATIRAGDVVVVK